MHVPENSTANSQILVDPSSSSSTVMNEEKLVQLCTSFETFFLPLSLLPSVFIILLLSFVERRKKLCECESRFPCLRGRFDLVVPLDFTGKMQNRWSYGFAFGAVTPFVINLIFSKTNILNLSLYLKLLEVLLNALMVSVACMPLFACLSTPHRLLGGVLGLLYTLSWLIALLWKLIFCRGMIPSLDSLTQLVWVNNIPQLVCLAFLVCRFGFSIKKGLKIRMRNYSKEEELNKHEYKHVQRLLRRPVEGCVQKSWFQIRFYDWDPYFKFPNRIIATVVLSVFGVYMTIATEQVLWTTVMYVLLHFSKRFMTKDMFYAHLNDTTYIWYISTACATLSSLIHISQVLVCYRKHVTALRAGDKKYLPKAYKLDPVYGVMGFLKYPGFQIAFSVWGYLIVHMTMLVLGMLFLHLVISPIRENGLLSWLKWMAMCLSNFFILIALIAFQRVLSHLFFLQDKISPTDKDKPLALKNRKIFHNFNYFFFFFNMMLGIMSCIMRLIKSAGVGLMLVSRIERTIMPEGFETLDTSYCTWVGMIMADHHHSNPVLVCFCHLLIKHTIEGVHEDGYSRLNREPVAKNRVHIRWLLLYTLLRNPRLILLRKKHQRKNDKDVDLAFAWAVSNTA